MKFNSTINSYFDKFGLLLEKHSVNVLRIALAVIFIWFGYLKILGVSPAEDLIEKTVFYLPSEYFVPFLGYCEVGLGLGLMIKRLIPVTLVLLLLHMAATFMPFIILPDNCFLKFPFCLTIEGQYIVKNLVLISGALTVGAKYNPGRYNSEIDE